MSGHKRHKYSEDENRPATKGDVDSLAQITAHHFDRVDKELGQLKAGQARLADDVSSLKRGQAAILTVLQSIEGRLRDWEHIPATVERLRKHVFPHR